MKIRLNEWFSKCHQASVSYEIYRESPVCPGLYVQILLIITEGNFIESIIDISSWNLNMYINHTFPLKGSCNRQDLLTKIYCPVSGHRLCKSLVTPPQCPTPMAPSVCPTRHFPAAGSRASERELLLTCPTPSRRTVVNPGQSKCTDLYL